MAYKTKELEDRALSVIRKYKLIWITECPSFMDIAMDTFYNHGLEKSEVLKKEIQKNRDELKVGIRKKWYESDNPTLQIALYRLISTEDEFAKLTRQNVDLSTLGQPLSINVNFMPDE